MSTKTKRKVSKPIKIPKRTKQLCPPPSLKRSVSYMDLKEAKTVIHKCVVCNMGQECAKCENLMCTQYITNKGFADLGFLDPNITICSSRCFHHFLTYIYNHQLASMNF